MRSEFWATLILAWTISGLIWVMASILFFPKPMFHVVAQITIIGQIGISILSLIDWIYN